MNGSIASPFSKSRIEALSDGVFAIAMTLLVLELKVPELPRHVGSRELWHAVLEHWTVFFSFAVTFVLAGQFWLLHHVAFHYTRRTDQRIALLAIFFLMFVSLLPFSTAMLGSFSLRQPLTLALYFGNQLALGLLLSAHWWYAKRHDLLLIDRDDPVAARFPYRLATQQISCGVAILAAAFSPQWCFNAFVLTQVAGLSVIRRRARAARVRAASEAQA